MTSSSSGKTNTDGGPPAGGPGDQREQPPSTASRPARWFFVARLLFAVAIAGAGYLAFVALSHGPVAGCGPGSGCDKVLQSRWAYWLNIPVSIPALLVYAALFWAVGQARKSAASPDAERGAWTAIIPLAVVVAGAALWFTGLQAFVIKAFCKFCLAAHACGLLAAGLCLYQAPVTAEAGVTLFDAGSDRRGVPFKAVFALGLAGILGLGVLAAGQLFVQKQLNVVTVFPRDGTNAVKSVVQRPSTNPGAPPFLATNLPPSPNLKLIGPRLLSLYNDKFLLRLDNVPMIGSPDAPHIIVNLFDYNCLHCRSLHPILLETQRILSNQLGIVCLPVGMATNCNPLMLTNWPSMTNSCESARLVLAVYHAAPSKYVEFADWVFGQERAPGLEAARAFAAQLVGADVLQASLANPWIDQQILTACELHRSNYDSTGRALMPHLILGPVISAGPLNSTTHLLVLLERYLGLKVPL